MERVWLLVEGEGRVERSRVGVGHSPGGRKVLLGGVAGAAGQDLGDLRGRWCNLSRGTGTKRWRETGLLVEVERHRVGVGQSILPGRRRPLPKLAHAVGDPLAELVGGSPTAWASSPSCSSCSPSRSLS